MIRAGGSHQLTWNRLTADCYRLLSELYVRASPLYQDYRAIPTLAAPPADVETPPSPSSTDLEKKDTKLKSQYKTRQRIGLTQLFKIALQPQISPSKSTLMVLILYL